MIIRKKITYKTDNFVKSENCRDLVQKKKRNFKVKDIEFLTPKPNQSSSHVRLNTPLTQQHNTK